MTHVCFTSVGMSTREEFSSLYKWFVDNKLPIHFNEGKTKCILFNVREDLPEFSIVYANNNMVEYFGCYLDFDLNESPWYQNLLRKSVQN